MGGKVSLSSAPRRASLASAAPSIGQVRPAVALQPIEQTERPDLRLIIEETGEPGRYVYILVDRRTGKIISQLPRDQLGHSSDLQALAAGSVINAKA